MLSYFLHHVDKLISTFGILEVQKDEYFCLVIGRNLLYYEYAFIYLKRIIKGKPCTEGCQFYSSLFLYFALLSIIKNDDFATTQKEGILLLSFIDNKYALYLAVDFVACIVR